MTLPRGVSLALAVTLVAGSLPGAASAAGWTYRARLVDCRRSPRIDVRRAVVEGAMRPVDGAAQLEMRLDLYQRRLAAGGWTLRRDVPGLGQWTAPLDPALGRRRSDVFKYRQAVNRLAVPYAYRFRASFRWLAADGTVLRQRVATTRACRQPDLRPDLTIPRVRMEAADGGATRYVVLVRNVGASTARGVLVGAQLPGDATTMGRTRTIRRLRPGAGAEVAFTGPTCTTAALASFVVDPANAIDERNEGNNAASPTCPAA